MCRNKNHINGFTLIELLIVLSLTMMLSAIAIPIYGNWHVNAEIDGTADRIVGSLRLAKEQSGAGYLDSFYGLSFESGRYALNQVSPDTGTSTLREEIMNGSLAITTSLQDNEIYFIKGLGAPDRTGTITLEYEGQTRLLEINSLGLAERK